MGFIGRNGAGKTTTLKCLMNMAHPDGGEVRFFGLPFMGNEMEIKGRIGFVSGGVDFYMKKKLSSITAVTRRFYSQWDEAAYQMYLRRFSLDDRKTPYQLSAGMRVKYALALALSHGAEFLILDEPTSGLDPISREDLLDVFLQLAREGVSILFSTHITSDLEKCADAITYIRQGRIQASESLDAFIARYDMAELTEQEASALQGQLIGCKRAKRGFTALLPSDRTAVLSRRRPATLEEIMIHLEKEENGHEKPAV